MLFVCLFVCLFICLFVYLFVCLFVYLFVCLEAFEINTMRGTGMVNLFINICCCCFYIFVVVYCLEKRPASTSCS